MAMTGGLLKKLALLVTFAAGGLTAGLLVLAGLNLFGTPALCAKGLLCDMAGYRNVGAARGVHLTGTADPYTSFAVVWETPGRQRPPRVQYRRAGGAADWRNTDGRSEPAPANGLVASSAYVHRVRVEGLDPATRYEYRVSWDRRSAERAFSPTLTTRTLSPGQPVRLAFVADVCLRDRPDGRSGPIDRIMNDIAGEDVDMILGGGDYACALDDGRYVTAEPAIQRFFDEWQPLLSAIPFVGQYGNHECCHGEKAAFWDPRLALSWAPMRPEQGRSFAFDLAGARIVGFYGTGADASADPGELAWLESTLGDAANAGLEHLLVYQHGPVFGAGRTHPPQPEFRRQVVPVLEQARVDLHLSAHDMSYERTLPLTGGADGRPEVGSSAPSEYDDWTGVIYAKVSPAGRETSRLDNLPDPLPPYIAVGDDEHFFYAVVTLIPEGAMRFVAYAFDDTGERSIVDQFTINR